MVIIFILEKHLKFLGAPLPKPFLPKLYLFIPKLYKEMKTIDINNATSDPEPYPNYILLKPNISSDGMKGLINFIYYKLSDFQEYEYQELLEIRDVAKAYEIKCLYKEICAFFRDKEMEDSSCNLMEGHVGQQNARSHHHHAHNGPNIQFKSARHTKVEDDIQVHSPEHEPIIDVVSTSPKPVERCMLASMHQPGLAAPNTNSQWLYNDQEKDLDRPNTIDQEAQMQPILTSREHSNLSVANASNNHQQAIPLQALAEVHKCPKCDKTFSEKRYLRTHLGGPCSESRKSFKCHICNLELTSQRNLKNHIETKHSEVRKWKCNMVLGCNKSFKYKCDLDRHQREHTGEMFGPCKRCGRKFNSKGNYDKHVSKRLKSCMAAYQDRLNKGEVVDLDNEPSSSSTQSSTTQSSSTQKGKPPETQQNVILKDQVSQPTSIPLPHTSFSQQSLEIVNDSDEDSDKQDDASMRPMHSPAGNVTTDSETEERRELAKEDRQNFNQRLMLMDKTDDRRVIDHTGHSQVTQHAYHHDTQRFPNQQTTQILINRSDPNIQTNFTSHPSRTASQTGSIPQNIQIVNRQASSTNFIPNLTHHHSTNTTSGQVINRMFHVENKSDLPKLLENPQLLSAPIERSGDNKVMNVIVQNNIIVFRGSDEGQGGVDRSGRRDVMDEEEILEYGHNGRR